MHKSQVLVVDDDAHYRKAVSRILQRAGHEVLTAHDAADAMQIVSTASLDLVLCDVKMPGISGLELVRRVHELAPDLPCIVITGYGGGEASVDALRAGAFWYLEKSMDGESHDVLRRLTQQAIEHGHLKAENRRLQQELQGRYKFENVIGQSEALRRVLDLVERVADTDSTVLITGESGTGKEVVARALHWGSGRAERPFVTVNCGAIPEELLESELFGHVKGAFTGAANARVGRFQMADGGTLFLDEIGDMSPNLQVKLLRALQDQSFEPVGSSETQRVDVRIIAATNQDLERAIQEKRFREDLFYRLNVIPIETPSLRDRHGDVPLLVHHFLSRFANEKSLGECTISDEALQRLVAFDWPGNVRELENLIERLVVLRGGGEIELDDLPPAIRSSRHARDDAAGGAGGAPSVPPTGLSFPAVVDRFESDLILQALEQTQWNKNQAAKLLGLNRTTLLEKIKKKGLAPEE